METQSETTSAGEEKEEDTEEEKDDGQRKIKRKKKKKKIVVAAGVAEIKDEKLAEQNSDAKFNLDEKEEEAQAQAQETNMTAPHTVVSITKGLSKDEEKVADDIMVASFKIRWRSGRHRSAAIAFWPANRHVTVDKAREILFKTWKLQPPNVIINLDAGAAHPKCLTTERLLDLPQFAHWRRHADAQAEQFRNRETSLNEDSATRSPKNHLDSFLCEQLISVYAAVLEASARTNNYIVVDRTRGASPTAELLLELAVKKSSSIPVILVIDCAKRLAKVAELSARRTMQAHGEHSFDMPPDVREFEDRLARQAEVSARMVNQLSKNAIHYASDRPTQLQEFEASYDIGDFENPTWFKDLVLPKAPLPEHQLEIGKGVPVRVVGDPNVYHVAEKRLWIYHYSQYLFQSGTHYMIVQENEMFPWDELGQVGCIFAHGGTDCAGRMRAWLEHGRPTVMLNNSGGVTQAFSSLHSLIVNKGVRDIQSCLEQLEITSTENWARDFGLQEIVMMQELCKRGPAVVRSSIVSVDILRDTAEDVLHVVSRCFATITELPELGLRTAEEDVVLRAWSYHVTLYKTAMKQKKISDRLFYSSAILMFLIAFLVALKMEIQRPQSILHQTGTSFEEVLYLALLTAPILSGIVATITQRRRALEKWGVLYTASMSIVAEIYKFRLQVLEYEPGLFEDIDSQAGIHVTSKINFAAISRKSRATFVSRVQDIFAVVLGGEMKSDALEFSDGQKMTRSGGGASEVLKRHVRTNLLHQKPEDPLKDDSKTTRRTVQNPIGKSRITLRRSYSAELFDGTTDDIFLGEVDDLTTIMTIEAYVDERARPLARHYGKRASSISREQNISDTISVGCNALAMILALPRSLDHWVGLVISLRVIIINIVQYRACEAQLGALNTGISDINGLMTWWDSLSVIDRRTGRAKTHAVRVVEQAMLNESASRTPGVAKINQPDDQGHEKRDDDNKEDQAKKTKGN